MIFKLDNIEHQLLADDMGNYGRSLEDIEKVYSKWGFITGREVICNGKYECVTITYPNPDWRYLQVVLDSPDKFLELFEDFNVIIKGTEITVYDGYNE